MLFPQRKVLSRVAPDSKFTGYPAAGYLVVYYTGYLAIGYPVLAGYPAGY